MPDSYLNVRQDQYVSDLRVSVFACRAFAKIRFVNRSGGLTPISLCVVDSGAPFSVIPFSLWQGLNLQWKRLGSRLTFRGSPAPKALDWYGVACDLGEATVYLIDARTGTQTGPFLLLGKFARTRQSKAELERLSLLGLNFILDNSQFLTLSGAGGHLAGYFSVP